MLLKQHQVKKKLLLDYLNKNKREEGEGVVGGREKEGCMRFAATEHNVSAIFI